nr:hypothetical protein [Tanacetum cinerariifolium]
MDWNALEDLFCSFSPLKIKFYGLGQTGEEAAISKRSPVSKSSPSIFRTVLDGAFRGVGDEEVVVEEGVVVTSSSPEMLTNRCLGGILVSLIFLEGLEEEALVEFMVEWFEEDDDGKKNGKDGLFNLKA